MKLQPLDLVLRFDASSDKVLLLVPKAPDELDTLKSFFEIPVAEGITVTAFADEIGAAVASFMHARHGDRFRVEIEEGPNVGNNRNEEVTFEDARLLIDRLGDSSKMSEIDAVDVLLERASTRGDSRATQYLRDVWPELRAVFVRRISREAPRGGQ